MSADQLIHYQPDGGTPFSRIPPRIIGIAGSRLSGRWRTDTFRHPFYAVSLVEEGNARITIAGTPYDVTAGSLTLFSPGIAYRGRSLPPYTDYRIISFRIDFGSAEKLPPRLSPENTRRAKTILTALLHIAAHRTADHRSLKTLLIELYFLYGHTPSLPYASSIDRVYESCARAKDHILRHIDEPFTLKAVAASADLSPSRLEHVFKERTGQTLRQYYLSLKIADVKRMLLATAMTVTDIADRTGFSSIHHLTTLFTRETGVSPAAYRKKQTAVSCKETAVSSKDNGPVL